MKATLLFVVAIFVVTLLAVTKGVDSEIEKCYNNPHMPQCKSDLEEQDGR